jgi:hypothetical protein
MQLTLAYHPITEIHFGTQTRLDGTVLVIDPEELRRAVPGGRNNRKREFRNRSSR